MILFFALVLFGCDANTSTNPEMNNAEFPTSDSLVLKDTMHTILVNSASAEPYIESSIRGADCKIVMFEEREIKYIQTDDLKFVTEDGYKIGDTFGSLPDSLQNNLITMTGWAYYIELPSKWCLAFCEGNSCTENRPRDSSKVDWIFQRNKKFYGE